MENASKAFIMSAEILLGVILISLGVYVFSVFGNYSKNTYEQMEDAQIAQFNNQFLKYTGERTNSKGEREVVKSTIHDIVSLANLAKKNNEAQGLTDPNDNYTDSSYYVRIDLKCKNQYINNLEKKDSQFLLELIKNHAQTADNTYATKYFECIEPEHYIISQVTKRIVYMRFNEI